MDTENSTVALAGDGTGRRTADLPSLAPHRAVAIAALCLELARPSARHWRIIRRSTRRVDDPARVLALLLLESAAPSAECADPHWYWGLTREDDAELIIAGRLRGFVPPEFLADAAKAAAAAVFGATITIERRDHDSEREQRNLVAIMAGGAA